MELAQFAKSRRGGELIGIIVLAAGVSLAAALLTYHPTDSSAFFTSTNTIIKNAIGYYGATIAWIFVGFFGFASLVFPSALLVIGWNRFWGKELAYAHTKVIGFLILALSIPPLFDLATGKVWLRGALIPSGGYLGQELDRVASSNLNPAGAAIVIVTAILVGLLLATRISLAAVFLALHRSLVALWRTITMHVARMTERRRKEKMKETVLRKHLRLVGDGEIAESSDAVVSADTTVSGGPVVREVKGRGKFQIRKVTKADLRKAAEELAKAETPDPFELYATARAPEPEFEEPLYLDAPSIERNPVERRPSRAATIAKPVPKREPAKKRETCPSNDLLPPVNLLTIGPKQDQLSDDVHKKFLEIGHLIEDRCREFSVEGEVTAYHPGPVVTTFEFKPSAGVK